MTPLTYRTSIRRGVKGQCPRCGEGRLFSGYLKLKPRCETCGQDHSLYRADDAPAWLTIILVGHLFLAPLLYFALPLVLHLPLITVMLMLCSLTLALTLAVLPFAKGAIVGMECVRVGR